MAWLLNWEKGVANGGLVRHHAAQKHKNYDI